ncbi:MAG: YceI family protein [Ginsengibacter sp.]
MIKFALSFILLTYYIQGKTQVYMPDDAGSKVHFSIKNFGINTGGDLHGLKGNINFIPSSLIKSSLNVSVDVKTIDTDNGTRDEHLRSSSYFDEENFPTIVIKSTKIDKTNKIGGGWYYFTGTLTMHGITKSISFPFTATSKNEDYLFTGTFDINRLDFGVGSNSSVLSKTVKVSLSVLARKR